MIPSLEWTGEALYDVANARIRAAVQTAGSPRSRSLLDESITEERLIDAFRVAAVPRHLFKFLYRLLVAHCNAHTDDKPDWHISRALFESTLALSLREQDAFDRGGPGCRNKPEMLARNHSLFQNSLARDGRFSYFLVLPRWA